MDSADDRQRTNTRTPAAAVIFDVDGTILRPGCRLQDAHMGAMAEAIEHHTGVTVVFRHVGGDLFILDRSLAGCTDAGTIDLALELHGASPAERTALRPRIVATMCRFLAEATSGSDTGCEGDLLPGIARLVSQLRAGGAVVGLSTGNARAVAALKMRRVGLPGLGELGGFGDHHLRRVEIARAAVAAVQATALTLRPECVLLIGDTVSDVTAARAAGARSLAVGTGAATPDVLREAGPDALVTSLADVDGAELLAALRAFGPLVGPMPAESVVPYPG